MARNDVYLNINALSPADAVVTGQQDMTAATVPELVLGDTPTFNFLFTDNTNVWPSWAGNASYTLTWALSDAVAGDFAPAATTGNATPITGGWSVILPLNSYDLVGLLNTKRVGQPYPVQNLWQQLRVTDPSGNEVTRAMFWTPVRYRAISDTQNTESASPTGGRFVTVNNVNTLTTPTAAQFYAANPVPTSALGTAANGELLIGNGTGFTKATLTAGSGVSITNGSGSITISATDGDITLDDGTAAAPSLKFTADTDTGIYRPSDNVVGISAGGVSRATFGATSAINGTTIPGSKTLVVTTDKLSALAATTSAELAGVISDETGSGALVFANTPTLVTPNIGAATGTSFNLTGSGTLGTTLTVNGTTDSSSKDTGAIVTEGGLGVEKSASIGGNLTVSGTTGSTFGQIARTNGTNATVLTLSDNLTGVSTAGFGLQIRGTSNNGGCVSAIGFENGGTGTNNETQFSVYTQNGANALTKQFTIGSTGNATLSGNLTVSGGTITGGTSGLSLASGGTNQNITLTPSGTGKVTLSNGTSAQPMLDITNTNTVPTKNGLRILGPNATSSSARQFALIANSTAYGDLELRRSTTNTGDPTSGDYIFGVSANGNFLIGTTTDGGQKLQVAGTGYFADVVEVSKSAASTNLNALTLRNSSYNVGESTSIVLTHGTGSGKPVTSISSYLPGSNQSELVFYTSNTSAVSTEALRINGSQNATFAGNIKTAAPSGGTAATWRLGTVASVSPTSPNRTIEVEIGGTTYYIHAKTTNN